MANNLKLKENETIIFRPWITDKKTGKRLYAKHYGKRAWPIKVSIQKAN